MSDPVRFRLVAGEGPDSAIGVIDLVASTDADLEVALRALGVIPLPVGAVGLRSFGGVDSGVAARWSATSASLFPHAGLAVLRGVRAWLLGAGLREEIRPGPLSPGVETGGLIEACAVDAIARADSPLAVDLILLHRDRWLEWERGATIAEMDPAFGVCLNRLRRAPVVALVGAPNIGKSALTNAMARRAVAVVADVPGTTRDHVGVTLDLGGLTVRWVDTPGVRADSDSSSEREAIEIASSVIDTADLVLECLDCAAPGTIEPRPDAGGRSLRLTVLTRADLGPPARSVPDSIATSAVTGEGLDDLTRRVRETLLPPEALESGSRWRFHDRLP